MKPSDAKYVESILEDLSFLGIQFLKIVRQNNNFVYKKSFVTTKI